MLQHSFMFDHSNSILGKVWMYEIYIALVLIQALFLEFFDIKNIVKHFLVRIEYI